MDGSLDLRTRRNIARNVSELDLLDLQRQGQELYRQKKYEEALKCFDQAILSDTKAPTSVLDNRAATYTKLGKLKPALRDGKRMIEKDKSNCSGYLRTCQVLQLMGNLNTALLICHLGLRNVRPSDVQAKILQKMRDDLTRRCSPPKAIDPMEILPIEIVEMIIGYLSFRQTVILLRVSKPWKTLLSSLPRLWTQLDLKKGARLTAVRQYVKYAQGTCSTLHFSHFAEERQQDILKRVVSRCRDLREIRISSGFIGTSFAKTIPYAENLKCLVISPEVKIYPDMAMQLVNGCVNLECAEIHQITASARIEFTLQSLPNLHTLTLNTPSARAAILRIDQLAENIPNLRSLTLRGWNMLDTPRFFPSLLNLESLDIRECEASLPPRLPITLQSLNMAKAMISHAMETTPKPHNLPNLSTLILQNYLASDEFYVPQLWQLLEANKGGLKTLDLSGEIDMTVNDINFLVTNGFLSGVEKLRLCELPIDDSLVYIISENLSQLKILDLACTKVSGVGVKALLTGLDGTLEWLGLNECFNVSLDAVNLARSKGVNVSHRFPDNSNGKNARTFW